MGPYISPESQRVHGTNKQSYEPLLCLPASKLGGERRGISRVIVVGVVVGIVEEACLTAHLSWLFIFKN